MLEAVGFCSPRTLKDALDALSNRQCRPIAGGTDLVPAIRAGRLVVAQLVDLGRLDELRFIRVDESQIEIGATTTYQGLIESEALNDRCPLIIEAARMVGAQQTRNRGTVGGSLGNASPAADLLPPLLALDAEVSLVSGRGERVLPLACFLLGPGTTVIEQGELIHHIRFTLPPQSARGTFRKLGRRAGMACAVANLALLVQQGADGVVTDIRLAVGAVAPTAIRLRQTELILKDHVWSRAVLNRTCQAASSECTPIDDVRASARYRRRAVAALLKQALLGVLEEAP